MMEETEFELRPSLAFELITQILWHTLLVMLQIYLKHCGSKLLRTFSRSV
jgi:hypothetical protein